MTDLVQELIAKKNSSKRPLINFGHALKVGFKYIICIEGNDEPYYSNIIRSRLNTDDIGFVRCDGRENVIDLLKILCKHTDKEYRNAFYFGFVDKDYHLEYINPFPEKLYITSSYSFENYYTSLASYKRTLSAIFHTKSFGDFSEDFDRCLKNFLNTRNKFLQSIFQIDHILRSAFYDRLAKVHTKKVTYAEKVKLSNSEFLLDDFIPNWSPTVNNWVEVKSEYISSENFEKCKYIYVDFNDDHLSMEIRGKYIFDFYVRYLKLLLKDATLEESPICFIQRKMCESNRKTKLDKDNDASIDKEFYCISIQESSFNEPISFLAAFADVPECLKIFIDTHMKSIHTLASVS